MESQWKLRQQHDQIFPMEGKPLEQILALEEIDKSKRAGLLESQSEIKVGKLIIRVRSFEITRSTSSRLTLLKVSEDKHIYVRTYVRTTSMLDEIESKTAHKDEGGDR